MDSMYTEFSNLPQELSTSRSRDRYTRVAIVLHWLVALAVPAMFVLGAWMVDLGYYDPWRKEAPEIHKAVGVLLFLIVVARLAWRLFHRPPAPLPTHAPWERRSAAVVHVLLYVLLLATMLAGYLISTADGRPIEVFGWFSVPALISGLPNQEDIAGELHLWLAILLLSLAAVHALAALKHHFVDRDRTLLRMLGLGSNRGEPTDDV